MTESAAESNVGEQNIVVNDDTGNTNFSVPNQVGDQQVAQSPQYDLMDIIPDSYKDRAWLKKYNTIEDMFKGMDGAQELIGKRPAGIPHENASPEEWNEFYNKLGRPESPDKYNIEYPQDLPEGVQISDEQHQNFTKLAHEIGLTQKQVEQLAAFDMKRTQDTLASMHPDMEALDREFDDFAKSAFGERQDQAIENAQKLISKHAPKEMHEHLQNLGNKELIALTSVLDAVTQNYIREDSTMSQGTTPEPVSRDMLMKEAHDLMRSEAYRNQFHVDHEITRRRIDEIYRATEK